MKLYYKLYIYICVYRMSYPLILANLCSVYIHGTSIGVPLLLLHS